MNKSDILDLIRSSPSPVTKRDIAKAFRVKGGEPRIALKRILKELEGDGIVTKHAGGGYSVPDGLPAVCVVEVNDIDIDGDVFARPVEWDAEHQGEPPRIEIMPDKKGHPALKTGDRALARLTPIDDKTYEGHVIKRIDTDMGRVMGLLRLTKGGGILEPADKKAKYDFEVPQNDMGGAKDGDLVVAEIQPSRGLKRKKVRIIEVIGQRDDPKAISIISLHEAGLHEAFPAKVIEATKDLSVPSTKEREDLRDIPLITIDGADARDFDDAVYAKPMDDGGFHIIVAIADVAYYVRPHSPLDIEAQRRGNSTYFPDRVVPMLPEALSNDLCSLRPNENRACLAAHLWIDKDGNLKRHKFVRGLMKSHARTIYEQIQHLHDHGPRPATPEDVALQKIIKPLYDAYAVLDAARQKRGALDLDLPERQILIDKNGNMTGVKKRERLDSHKMIEEFMILANVAAAQAIEARGDHKSLPCVYRIHDRPSLDKLESAREFIDSFGLSLPKGQVVKPAQINHVLRKAADMDYSHLISTVILRTQSQAVYSRDNIGHFGLALSKYAHFTSPIRRYADLLVHRALIKGYKLGPGGMDDTEIARIQEICEHISGTERTSMEAERNAVDRFTAAYLSDKIGAEFSAKITGVTRFGLFAELDESGADGIIPMRSITNDFYVHDEKQHALIGKRHGRVFRLGARITVRLKEADGLTGSTVLELTGESLEGADIPGMELSKKAIQASRYGGQNHQKSYKNSRKKPGTQHKRSKKPPRKRR